MNLLLTDAAATLQFVSFGCDPGVQSARLSLETLDNRLTGPTEGVLVELFTDTPAAALQVVDHHSLAEDPVRAACLAPGTQVWTGWITQSGTRPVRCVVYAYPTSVRSAS